MENSGLKELRVKIPKRILTRWVRLIRRRVVRSEFRCIVVRLPGIYEASSLYNFIEDKYSRNICGELKQNCEIRFIGSGCGSLEHLEANKLILIGSMDTSVFPRGCEAVDFGYTEDEVRLLIRSLSLQIIRNRSLVGRYGISEYRFYKSLFNLYSRYGGRKFSVENLLLLVETVCRFSIKKSLSVEEVFYNFLDSVLGYMVAEFMDTNKNKMLTLLPNRSKGCIAKLSFGGESVYRQTFCVFSKPNIVPPKDCDVCIFLVESVDQHILDTIKLMNYVFQRGEKKILFSLEKDIISVLKRIEPNHYMDILEYLDMHCLVQVFRVLLYTLSQIRKLREDPYLVSAAIVTYIMFALSCCGADTTTISTALNDQLRGILGKTLGINYSEATDVLTGIIKRMQREGFLTKEGIKVDVETEFVDIVESIKNEIEFRLSISEKD